MTHRVSAVALPGIGMSVFAFNNDPGVFRHRPHICFDANANPSPEMEMKANAIALKAATDDVKKYAGKVDAEIKNLGKVTEETKANTDKALAEMNAISTRMQDIEQKMARRGEPAMAEQKSIGHKVIDSDEVKSMIKQGAGFRGRVSVEVKNITSASTTGTSGTTGLVQADRVTGIIQLPDRPLAIRDLLMPGRTESSSIDYVKETLYTNNAATVAENPSAPKPQSDLTFQLFNQPVRTIAHWVLASKQIMADAPMLQSYIDGRLRYGLAYAEDVQFLLGDGTGSNLLGLMPQATPYAAPAGVTVTNATAIDRLRLAMLQTTLALYPATGFALNPVDWTNIVLTKDSQNRYIFADPQAQGVKTLWGLPVAETMAMPVGNFLTGAMRLAAQIFDREDATVLISTEDRDNFVKNMVTILAKERTALVVYRPAALIKGTFS